MPAVGETGLLIGQAVKFSEKAEKQTTGFHIAQAVVQSENVESPERWQRQDGNPDEQDIVEFEIDLSWDLEEEEQHAQAQDSQEEQEEEEEENDDEGVDFTRDDDDVEHDKGEQQQPAADWEHEEWQEPWQVEQQQDNQGSLDTSRANEQVEEEDAEETPEVTGKIVGSVHPMVKESEKKYVISCIEWLADEVHSAGGLSEYLRGDCRPRLDLLGLEEEEAEEEEEACETMRQCFEAALQQGTRTGASSISVSEGFLLGLGTKKVIKMNLILGEHGEYLASVGWDHDVILDPIPEY